jgi:hypothetical protein
LPSTRHTRRLPSGRGFHVPEVEGHTCSVTPRHSAEKGRNSRAARGQWPTLRSLARLRRATSTQSTRRPPWWRQGQAPYDQFSGAAIRAIRP